MQTPTLGINLHREILLQAKISEVGTMLKDVPCLLLVKAYGLMIIIGFPLKLMNASEKKTTEQFPNKNKQ